jgi:hypothetical protein
MTKIVTFADGFSSATAPTIESDTTKANITLNNLGVTDVNADILPNSTSQNLGSVTKKWGDVFANYFRASYSFLLGSNINISLQGINLVTTDIIDAPGSAVSIGTGNAVGGSNHSTGDLHLFTGAPDGVGTRGAVFIAGDRVDLDGCKITNLGTPTNTTDAATKQYVDNNLLYRETYANLVTWATAATNGSQGFSTDTKILYYVVDGVLQEIDVMRTISGAITTAQVTVGTTAVRATVSGSAPNANRKRLIITPSNIVGNIYLGGSGVTIANGRSIIGPDTIVLDWDSSDYYLISDTVGNTVSILEVV